MRPARSSAQLAGGFLILLGAIALLAPLASAEGERGDDAWLGIHLGGARDGVRVVGVTDDSPAATAGVERGDVIVAIDGREVERFRHLTEAVAERAPGETVRLQVRRDDELLDIDVTLGERPQRRTWSYGDRDIVLAPGLRHFGAVGPSVQLGVRTQPLTDGLRQYFGAPEELGVLVSDVTAGSAAERAGLRAGDVIVSVDRRDVGSVRSIRRALEGLKAGDRVEVVVLRDRAERRFEVELMERESPEHGRCHGCAFDFRFELSQEDRQAMFEAMREARSALEAIDLDDLHIELEGLGEGLEELREGLHEGLLDAPVQMRRGPDDVL